MVKFFMLLDELFQSCFKDHWDSPRYNLSGHSTEVKAKYRNHIKPVFGELDYLTITRVQIRDFHKSFSKTPVTGNRLLEIISKLYKFSIEREWNAAGYNPVVGVKHFTERKRRRYGSEAEIKKIGEVLEKYYDLYPTEIAFLYTLMFTGARPRSIERARYDELSESGDFGVLIFDGKSTEATGDPESVILPPKIMELIKKLPKRQDGLIFGIPLPGYLWRKIRKEAGCEDLWARDFRRTFASVGMSNKVDMKVIGQLLNHHSMQTTLRYSLLDDSARLEAVTAISAKLDSILKK
jgi:integrase